MFFVITRVQPPPSPAWDTARVVQWFHDNHVGILAGFAIVFAITGMTTASNALIAYSMHRMSVSPVFAYSYIVLYSLSAVPGMLLMCIALTVGALRPDRDPELIHWTYDFAFLSFVGTMGVFLIGSLVWMLAILIDRNRVVTLPSNGAADKLRFFRMLLYIGNERGYQRGWAAHKYREKFAGVGL